MRRTLTFLSEGETLVGTLDEASGPVGVLIVSGGRETRIGAHRGMALLAARLAARGIPVLRFDRRGVGDSSGIDGGYAASLPDILSARRLLGTMPIVGVGNCDAATALALFGRASGIDAVVLSNPWVIEPTDDLPPAAALRARYREKVADPATWRRLLRGGIDLRRLVRGLLKAASHERRALADRVLAGIAAWGDDAHIVLAARDATAIAFRAVAGDAFPATIIDTDSHSFARPGDAEALERVIVAAVERLANPSRHGEVAARTG